MKPGTLEEFTTQRAMAPLHVLIVEHSPNDVELILLGLQEAGLRVDYTVAENQEQFRRAWPRTPVLAFGRWHQTSRA